MRISEAKLVEGVVTAVDRDNGLVALEGPERELVIKVDDDVDLADLEKGQAVEVLYIQALAVVVEPAPEVSGTLTRSMTSVALGVGVERGSGTLTRWETPKSM